MITVSHSRTYFIVDCLNWRRSLWLRRSLHQMLLISSICHAWGMDGTFGVFHDLSGVLLGLAQWIGICTINHNLVQIVIDWAGSWHVSLAFELDLVVALNWFNCTLTIRFALLECPFPWLSGPASLIYRWGIFVLDLLIYRPIVLCYCLFSIVLRLGCSRNFLPLVIQ